MGEAERKAKELDLGEPEVLSKLIKRLQSERDVANSLALRAKSEYDKLSNECISIECVRGEGALTAVGRENSNSELSSLEKLGCDSSSELSEMDMQQTPPSQTFSKLLDAVGTGALRNKIRGSHRVPLLIDKLSTRPGMGWESPPSSHPSSPKSVIRTDVQTPTSGSTFLRSIRSGSNASLLSAGGSSYTSPRFEARPSPETLMQTSASRPTQLLGSSSPSTARTFDRHRPDTLLAAVQNIDDAIQSTLATSSEASEKLRAPQSQASEKQRTRPKLGKCALEATQRQGTFPSLVKCGGSKLCAERPRTPWSKSLEDTVSSLKSRSPSSTLQSTRGRCGAIGMSSAHASEAPSSVFSSLPGGVLAPSAVLSGRNTSSMASAPSSTTSLLSNQLLSPPESTHLLSSAEASGTGSLLKSLLTSADDFASTQAVAKPILSPRAKLFQPAGIVAAKKVSLVRAVSAH